MSFHITYLTMAVANSSSLRQTDLDRVQLLTLRQGDSPSETYHLFKASVSVLLTIVLPDESPSREEEVDLLRNPQGLWTVLMINYPRYHHDREQQEHLTPVAQFIRGITASVVTQRTNAESICDFLRHELGACDTDGLFDDEQFTKSKTYHHTIQGCSELIESLDATLRFLKKTTDGQIKELRSIVHPREELGVRHWTHELEEEIFSVRELRAQVEGLRRRAEESVRITQDDTVDFALD